MKIILITFSLVLSTLSFGADIAPVSSNDLIQAAKLNEIIETVNVLKAENLILKQTVVPVGTVNHSLLTLAQYQTQNGDCWKLLDGSPTEGTDLKAITGMTALPNATESGTFLRQAVNGRVLGSYEADGNKTHTHGPGNLSGYYRLRADDDSGSSAGGSIHYAYSSFNANSTSGSVIINSGATSAAGEPEAKPKNLAVNYFIKVNKACNFAN